MSSKKSKFAFIYNNILYGSLLSLVVTGMYLYVITILGQFSKIEKNLFTKGILFVILILLVLNLFYFLGFSKRIKVFRKTFFVVGGLLFILGSVASFYTYRFSASLNRIINTDNYETVEYSIIGFNEDNTIDNMDSGALGYIEHDEEFDAIMKDAIRPHSRVINYKEYKDYHEMLQASVDGEIQYALVPKDYSRLDESFTMIGSTTRPLENANTLFGFSTKVVDDSAKVEVLTEPFSVLLLGNNGGLSDSIIVATVNPKTLNVTMTSLARDSYLPIACYPNKSFDKLNHARARGRQCITDTIETYLGLEIDFYFETDFYALEKIVDALGGLELESPVAFGGSLPKEENPKEYHEIWINKGMQKMDGKQAITFARERHNMPRGDFDRQLNQQYVIKEVAQAIIKERNPDKLVRMLEGASTNITTNLSISTITQLLEYAIQQIDVSQLDATNTFRIESSQIVGTTPMIRGMSVIVPYKNDVIAAQNLIKQNLIAEPSLKNVRNFSFNINEPYQTETQKRSKYGDSSGGTIDIGNVTPDTGSNDNDSVNKPDEDTKILVPDFTDAKKYTIEDLRKWASENGIKLQEKVTPDDGSKYVDGQILYQDYPGESVSLNLLKQNGLRATIAKVEIEPSEPETPESFELKVYKERQELIDWYAKWGLVPNITEDETTDKSKDGQVFSYTPGTYTLEQLKALQFKVYKYVETGGDGSEVENPTP